MVSNGRVVVSVVYSVRLFVIIMDALRALMMMVMVMMMVMMMMMMMMMMVMMMMVMIFPAAVLYLDHGQPAAL